MSEAGAKPGLIEGARRRARRENVRAAEPSGKRFDLLSGRLTFETTWRSDRVRVYRTPGHGVAVGSTAVIEVSIEELEAIVAAIRAEVGR